MAHHYVYADKDATILRGANQSGTSSLQNFGLDEVLEVGKTFQVDSTNIASITRALIKFPLTEISKSIVNGEIPATAKYYLNMYDAGTRELNISQSLKIYAVSQSWVEGSGKHSDDPPTSDGVSWKFRNGQLSGTPALGEWSSGSVDGYGATYFSGSTYTASVAFNKDDKADMRVDVTNIVGSWLGGATTIPNEGFLISRTDADEVNDAIYGQFRFFSADTHTVFRPKLEVEWDDAVWVTGSLSPLSQSDLENLLLYTKSFKSEYKLGSISKVRVCGREKYPTRTFATSSVYLDAKYLPSGSSFYSVVDTKTEDVLIPFGSGSKLSCDSTGNYFHLRTGGLEPERFYKLVFKVVSGSGVNRTEDYYDDGYTFKVVR
tara:strand:+ start:2296 stop:3423 length:1128 start_codon:yes stop_codon:yes gene_type:complete